MPLLDELYALSARDFMVPAWELRTTSKRAEVVEARWWAWRVLHARGWSYSAIARAAGVHHTTVMDGVKARGRLPYDGRTSTA